MVGTDCRCRGVNWCRWNCVDPASPQPTRPINLHSFVVVDSRSVFICFPSPQSLGIGICSSNSLSRSNFKTTNYRSSKKIYRCPTWKSTLGKVRLRPVASLAHLQMRLQTASLHLIVIRRTILICDMVTYLVPGGSGELTAPESQNGFLPSFFSSAGSREEGWKEGRKLLCYFAVARLHVCCCCLHSSGPNNTWPILSILSENEE